MADSSASAYAQFTSSKIINLLHAIDPADRFLRHLLLEERAHAALEHHAAIAGLDANLVARHVRVGRQSVVNAVEQRRG